MRLSLVLGIVLLIVLAGCVPGKNEAPEIFNISGQVSNTTPVIAETNVTNNSTRTTLNTTNVTANTTLAGGMLMRITSPAFFNNTTIPAKYTCQGQDINPPLQISDVPKEAQSLVLLVDDPDAPMGTWDHWVLFNMPTNADIGENSVPPGATVGMNSWPKNSYGGPCPPSGTHRYFFKLYALDNRLNLGQNAKKQDVERAMEGHIIAQAQLIGLYKKS